MAMMVMPVAHLNPSGRRDAAGNGSILVGHRSSIPLDEPGCFSLPPVPLLLNQSVHFRMRSAKFDTPRHTKVIVIS